MNMHKPLKHRPAARGSNNTKETYFTHVAREGLLLCGDKKTIPSNKHVRMLLVNLQRLMSRVLSSTPMFLP